MTANQIKARIVALTAEREACVARGEASGYNLHVFRASVAQATVCEAKLRNMRRALALKVS
jgi:hypothetical protein